MPHRLKCTQLNKRTGESETELEMISVGSFRLFFTPKWNKVDLWLSIDECCTINIGGRRQCLPPDHSDWPKTPLKAGHCVFFFLFMSERV